jgi:hypothetical protein
MMMGRPNVRLEPTRLSGSAARVAGAAEKTTPGARRTVGRLGSLSQFEQECELEGAVEIKVQARLYAVPFYLAMGYKKTTGIRRMRSFEGRGLQYQPLKKVLRGALR